MDLVSITQDAKDRISYEYERMNGFGVNNPRC